MINGYVSFTNEDERTRFSKTIGILSSKSWITLRVTSKQKPIYDVDFPHLSDLIDVRADAGGGGASIVNFLCDPEIIETLFFGYKNASTLEPKQKGSSKVFTVTCKEFVVELLKMGFYPVNRQIKEHFEGECYSDAPLLFTGNTNAFDDGALLVLTGNPNLYNLIPNYMLMGKKRTQTGEPAILRKHDGIYKVYNGFPIRRMLRQKGFIWPDLPDRTWRTNSIAIARTVKSLAVDPDLIRELN